MLHSDGWKLGLSLLTLFVFCSTASTEDHHCPYIYSLITRFSLPLAIAFWNKALKGLHENKPEICVNEWFGCP